MHTARHRTVLLNRRSAAALAAATLMLGLTAQASGAATDPLHPPGRAVSPATAAVDPVEPDRLYAVASVSKTYVTVAVMQLVEQGKVRLDAPVVTYVPDFRMADPRYQQITVRMLLDHSAGLMGDGGSEGGHGDGPTASQVEAVFLDTLADQRLRSEPGAESNYSNDSFTLAQLVVERVSGLDFTEYIAQHIAGPLGLTRTSTPYGHPQDLAEVVHPRLGRMLPESDAAIGAGGVYASAVDVARFGYALTDGADQRLLTPESVAEMTRAQGRGAITPADQGRAAYGLGFDDVAVSAFDQRGIKAVSKGGDLGFNHANLTVLPEHDLSVAVTLSSPEGSSSDAQDIATRIALGVLVEEGLIPADAAGLATLDQYTQVTPTPVPADEAERYAGLYTAGQITFDGDQMRVTNLFDPTGDPLVFTRTSDGDFIQTSQDDGPDRYLTTTRGTAVVTRWSFVEQDGQVFIIMQNAYQTGDGPVTVSSGQSGEKLTDNPLDEPTAQAWAARDDHRYLPTSAGYFSSFYLLPAPLELRVHDGYVGSALGLARITGPAQAVGFTHDRSLVDLTMTGDTLTSDWGTFVDSATVPGTATVGSTVTATQGHAGWFAVDEDDAETTWRIEASTGTASWHVYDALGNVVTSTLTATPPTGAVLPRGGYVAFVGDATFTVTRL
ncbi:MAG: beta-lactamase family protein [Micrococcales bacterium]|nr:beta-lactamase family protein [Micrococcales bacterium]